MGQSKCFGEKIAGPSPSGATGNTEERTDESGPSDAAAGATGNTQEGTDEAGPSGTAAGATGNTQTNPQAYTFSQLRKATRHFRNANKIGEGGSARVFKGTFKRTGQIVAVKKLKPAADRNSNYNVEVGMLSRLNHPNIINLIGLCAEGNKRLIVCEFMPLGSLQDQLHARKPGQQPLDWNTRMKIAAGVAKGLNYLHYEANPPVIYRDLKPSNVLLGDGYQPKISDFGIAQSAPSAAESTVRVTAATAFVGSYPYKAPDDAITGKISLAVDVFSFGVVLLEIIAGYLPLDDIFERFVADWVKKEANFVKLADKELRGQFPEDMLKRALKLAATCMNPSDRRPNMSVVVRAMDFLTSDPDAGAWPAEFTLEADASSSQGPA